MENLAEQRDALLLFAESVANSRSGNLHGFHSEVVKSCGGTLEKRGRYRAGSAAWEPHAKYTGGKWVAPVYDPETDSYSYAV